MTAGVALGSFDMFHVGHLSAIRQAQAEVDSLVLAVADDALVLARRGGAPMVPVAERCEVLDAFFPDLSIDVVADDRLAELVSRFDPDVVFVCGPEASLASADGRPSFTTVRYEPTTSESLLATLEPEILWSPR